MSKDTYSDNKKIECFKSLEIQSGKNVSSGQGDLLLTASNSSDIIISPDVLTVVNGKRMAIQPENTVDVNTKKITHTASGSINMVAGVEVTSESATRNYIQSNNLIELDSKKQIYVEADTTVDIRGNYIRVLSSTDIKLGSEAHTNSIALCGTRVTYSDAGGPVTDHRFILQDNTRFIIHKDYAEVNSTSMAYEDFQFYCRGTDSSYMAYMANANSSDGSDILLMDFPNKTDAGSNTPADVYIRFNVGGYPSGGSGSLTGNIAGAIKLLEKGEPAFRGYSSSSDTTPENAGIAGSVNPVRIGNSLDGVCYATGNSDFGEWIECGDKNEWSDIVDLSYVNKNLKDTDIKRLGLIEGMVAYVRDLKFWRTGPGTPMLVTRRAAVLGNIPGSNSAYIGEVFSFIGQISVLVNGVANCGDYIIPEKNHCLATPKDSITFDQYKEALGICWEDKTSEELGRVVCAIGIK